jgi:serine/threonine-protein kinase
MSADDTRIGRVLAGKYKIQRLLGTGSMGAVFQGSHIDIGKRVAIKLMNPEYADTPELVARFRREARAASAVDSDYIVQVFDAGQDPACGVYMVTELLVGEDLESRLAREQRLDAPTAALIGYQVARGLAKAHGAGVVHRDLKPPNVFLTQRDDDALIAKILDFGISKVSALLDESPMSRTEANLTQAGLALGTPQYMSPEQAQALPDIDAKTDVWSLGAVLYECLAGGPPFPDTGSYFDVMVSIVRQPVPDLASAAPWVPAGLAEVVKAALQKDRRARPDATMFARMLVQALPDRNLRSSGRLSLPEIADLAPAPSAPAPDPPRDDKTIEEPATESGIPVSIAYDPGEEEEAPPATERQPMLPELGSVAPPSSADDQVEIFHRVPDAKDRGRDPSRR